MEFIRLLVYSKKARNTLLVVFFTAIFILVGAEIKASELHDAAKLGNMNKIRILIKQGVDINEKEGEYLNTPLHYAAAAGHFDTVEFW